MISLKIVKTPIIYRVKEFELPKDAIIDFRNLYFNLC